MPKVWSMNTTIRNPERITDIFKVLKPLEGLEFNKETQNYILEDKYRINTIYLKIHLEI